MKDATQIVIDMLNNALKNDPKAINELFQHYTKVNNDSIEKDPFIVLGEDASGADAFSVLGIVNGIMNAYGVARVAAQYDDNGNIVGFQEYIVK